MSAQPLIHNTDVPITRGLGYMTVALVGFYLGVRVVMAIMTAVEARTSLWPSRLISIQVYCIAFATAEIMQAIRAYDEVTSESFLVWSSEPATGTALSALFVLGVPLTVGFGMANWVRLRFIQPDAAEVDR